MEVNIWGLRFKVEEWAVMCICITIALCSFFTALNNKDSHELYYLKTSKESGK